jgi:ATP-dependent DNA helicase RecG
MAVRTCGPCSSVSSDLSVMSATAQGVLTRPLADVLGGKTAKALAALGIEDVEGLLRHYPRRYAERGELSDLRGLQVDEHVTVVADIEKVQQRPMRNRRGSLLEVTVTDGNGRLTLTYFNQAWRERDLRPGRRGLFSGKVGEFRGARQLAHPEYVLLPDSDEVDVEAAAAFANALIPVYPATSALPSWRISACVDLVLPLLDSLSVDEDLIPPDIRLAQGLIGLEQALRAIHRPATRDEAQEAMRRLRWDEAFVLQVELARRRQLMRAMTAVARPGAQDGVLAAFDAQLPFPLTTGQQEVGAEILIDLAQERPMHRLLQGDVGSGKTLVALRAMLAVVDSGGQAVLLAPTEVLAQQHQRSLRTMLGSLALKGMLGGSDVGTRVTLLTGSMSTSQRRAALLDMASGAAGIVVGTHALLQDNVQFADLGLIVIDEQHRFGVEQRAALSAKGRDGQRPHVLVMTATPIPRTVAMTVFGDLDVSTLTELPPGRAPITTHVVAAAEKPAHLERAWHRIHEEVQRGRTAYVVCPRIGGDVVEDADLPAGPADPGEEVRRQPLAAIEVAALLSDGPLADLRVAVLHGRMPSEAKEDVMSRFADLSVADHIDVVVSTTVIEVGVDVPHASVMVVMDAERFGVSQLHQLRGRVGRAGLPGLCLLVTEAPAGSQGRDRLDAVAATTDGFELARFDLESRREGDVLGANQSGRRSSLRLLEVLRDEPVIVAARDAAESVIQTDPDLINTPALRRAVDALAEDDRSDFLDRG